jgi:2-C-methyl-D-erythritol 4-phosphate cytidylyltransferase
MPASSRRTYAVLLGAAAGLEEDVACDIALLEALGAVDEIHVWVPGQDVETLRGLVGTNSREKLRGVNAAGATRDATIFDALTLIRPTARDEDLVLIADVERRSLTESTVSSCLSVAAEQGAAILASPVVGDVIQTSQSGTIGALPREGWTFRSAGLLVTQFSRFFDLYDWAATVARESIESPYRWSLSQLKPVILVANEGGRVHLVSEVISESSTERRAAKA